MEQSSEHPEMGGSVEHHPPTDLSVPVPLAALCKLPNKPGDLLLLGRTSSPSSFDAGLHANLEGEVMASVSVEHNRLNGEITSQTRNDTYL